MGIERFSVTTDPERVETEYEPFFPNDLPAVRCSSGRIARRRTLSALPHGLESVAGNRFHR